MKFIKIVFLFTFIFLVSCGHLGGTKFDSNKWKNSDFHKEENWNLRWNMVNDLRNNYNLIGKNKTEIINLLGESYSTFQEPNKMSYYLGYTGTGINTGTLYLILNEENIVTKIIVFEG